MYAERIQHSASGRATGGKFTSHDPGKKVARVEPNRKWFGNTRVVGQNELDRFRDEVGKALNPHTVLVGQSKIPMGLLTNPFKV